MLATSACNLLLVAWSLGQVMLPIIVSSILGSTTAHLGIKTPGHHHIIRCFTWPQVHHHTCRGLPPGWWTRAQVLAGAVIIKAHTPGAKRSSNAPDPFLCVRSSSYEVWDTLITISYILQDSNLVNRLLLGAWRLKLAAWIMDPAFTIHPIGPA